MARRTLLALIILALALPLAAVAQTRPLLNARVRVTAPPIRPDRVIGQVTQYDTAKLVVRDEATGTDQAFPLHSISLLEISHGATRGGSALQRARLLGFVLGGLGAIAGAVLQPFRSAGVSVAVTGGGGALLGAGIGAAWGSSTPHERWEWAVRPFGYDPSTRPIAPAAAPDSGTVATPPR